MHYRLWMAVVGAATMWGCLQQTNTGEPFGSPALRSMVAMDRASLQAATYSLLPAEAVALMGSVSGWRMTPSNGVAPMKRPPTTLTRRSGNPLSGPRSQLRPPSWLSKITSGGVAGGEQALVGGIEANGGDVLGGKPVENVLPGCAAVVAAVMRLRGRRSTN